MLVILAAALIFGVTMTLPIGGADMPVVISLLNSFTGTAVAMAGFVIDNPVLIIAGALVGASGAILTKLMADAMNRSVMNIMIGGFGGGDGVAGRGRRRGRLGPRDRRRRRRDPAGLRPARDRRPGLRPRGRPGPARGPRAGRAARGARRRRQVRDPPGRRPDAGPHERPPRRGERPLSPAQGDGRHQPRVRAGRRGPRRRRERRHEPGGAAARLAGLGHADPRRRPREVDRRDQALDGQGLRRHRQRALHEPEDRHALRRREGRPGLADRRRSRRCSGGHRPGSGGAVQKILNDPERVRRRDARGHPRRPSGPSSGASAPRAIVRAAAPSRARSRSRPAAARATCRCSWATSGAGCSTAPRSARCSPRPAPTRCSR